MSEATDPVNIIYKIQRLLDEDIDNLVTALAGGGVDSMENYKYIIGKIHALDSIKQEISNLLNPKEPENDDDKVTRIRR
jgi:hypothetical protein|tara:strand:+ start:507 stop:743 length:237 start_codon:yes stop_codon:yes gene_type:complete